MFAPVSSSADSAFDFLDSAALVPVRGFVPVLVGGGWLWFAPNSSAAGGCWQRGDGVVRARDGPVPYKRNLNWSAVGLWCCLSREENL